MRSWSTPADVEAKVRRKWDDGTLLRSYATGAPCPSIEVPLRGPTPSELGDDLDRVRTWLRRLDEGSRDGSRYRLQWTSIGGRYVGRNQVPSRAQVSTYDQAWALLGVRSDSRRFLRLHGSVGDRDPVRAWMLAYPFKALALEDDWPRLLAAYDWFDSHRGSGRYLREISAPGVDTKFAERHRPTLASLLGVSSTAAGFVDGLGLRGKPELVRVRLAPNLGLPEPLTEIAVRADELAKLDLAPRTALVVENEISYLSVPVPPGGMVVWGKGFEVDRVGRLPWLADVEVVYWGDIDTHGFAILDRLRAWLPQTRSVLMDRVTLLEHRDRWVVEDRPTASRLTRLGSHEQDLYDDLVSDRLGERVRLEQERIDWRWSASVLEAETKSPSTR